MSKVFYAPQSTNTYIKMLIPKVFCVVLFRQKPVPQISDVKFLITDFDSLYYDDKSYCTENLKKEETQLQKPVH